MRGYLDASEVARMIGELILYPPLTRAKVSNVQALEAKTICHVTLRNLLI